MGKARTPFIFVIDFDMKKPWVCPLSDVDNHEILFDVNGFSNVLENPVKKKSLDFDVEVVGRQRYQTAYDLVQKHISHGNSFLLNLTMPSRVSTNYTLKDIFHHSLARYKLWFKNQFVVFSPEVFIQTKRGKVSAFPMKGTIDASLDGAEQKLLESEKELAEHYTIVDLIRNDLSIVAKNVVVDKFRYIEKLRTNKGELLQMSSRISGDLPTNYHEKLGDIILSMLPAGSISGAPKKKTLEVIAEAEQYTRGYYTGVFGIFDGENIDSGVMIRFLEQGPDGLIYKSGGGITAMSNIHEEYQELTDKIYVPLA